MFFGSSHDQNSQMCTHSSYLTHLDTVLPRYANYNSDGLPVHDSSGNELGRREKEAMMKEQQKLKARWEAEEEKLFEDMGAVARLYNQTTTMVREDKQVKKKREASEWRVLK